MLAADKQLRLQIGGLLLSCSKVAAAASAVPAPAYRHSTKGSQLRALRAVLAAGTVLFSCASTASDSAAASLAALVLARGLFASGQLLQTATGPCTTAAIAAGDELPEAGGSSTVSDSFGLLRLWQTYTDAVNSLLQQLPQPGGLAPASQLSAEQQQASSNSSSSSSSSRDSGLLSILSIHVEPLRGKGTKLQQSLAARLSSSQASSSLSANTAAVAAAAGAPSSSGQDPLRPPTPAQLGQQLSAFGKALCAALPSKRCCNNPGCSNLQLFSEAQLVGGKACMCDR
jgi:hypothetical protein